MAAPTLLEIAQGIATLLDTISGLQASATYTGEVTPDAAQVGIPDIPEYHSTMQRGRMKVSGTIALFTSKADERIGQERISAYASPTGSSSIPATIYTDKTLGGKVEDIVVRNFRMAGADEVGDVPYFVGVFEWEAVALGS